MNRRSTTLEKVIAVVKHNMLNAIIFLIATSICTSCLNSRDECAQYLKEVDRLLADGKDSTVIVRDIGKIINRSNECLDLYLIRGDINLSLGNLEAAYDDFNMVIKRNKTNIYALYMLGVIYNEKQNFDSAILVLQNAINYKTQGSVVVDYRNEGLMKEKARYDVEYNELIYTQGLSHYYKRNLKQASNIFSFCISNNYRLGESYLFKGIITIETQKNYKEACKDIQLAEQYGNRNASMYKEKFCR